LAATDYDTGNLNTSALASYQDKLIT